MANKNKENESDKHESTFSEDPFIRYSGLFLQWLQKNVIAVMSVVGIAILIGLAWAGVQYYKNSIELGAQEEMFAIEKDYLKLKEKREKAKEEWEAQLAEKDKKKAKKKEKSADYPSGDMAKDYGEFIKRFSAFVKKHPNTNAAAIASLQMANLHYEYKKFSEGAALLQKAQPNDEILKGLRWLLLGTLQESLGDCKQANQLWQKVIDNSSVQYLHPEAMLKKAVCFQSLSQKEQARSIYEKIKKDYADSDAAKKASGYLRLLNVQGS